MFMFPKYDSIFRVLADDLIFDRRNVRLTAQFELIFVTDSIEVALIYFNTTA